MQIIYKSHVLANEQIQLPHLAKVLFTHKKTLPNILRSNRTTPKVSKKLHYSLAKHCPDMQLKSMHANSTKHALKRMSGVVATTYILVHLLFEKLSHFNSRQSATLCENGGKAFSFVDSFMRLQSTTSEKHINPLLWKA